MSQKLISKMVSGKVAYSEKAIGLSQSFIFACERSLSIVSILCNLRSDVGMHVQQQLYEASCSFRTMVRSLGLRMLRD